MDTATLSSLHHEALDFLWLELTEQCNLRCVHCYADSSPEAKARDRLSFKDYCSLIDSAAELGCRKLQFIGGEPTLNPELPRLIAHARTKDFEFVEVFTNATRLSEQLINCFVEQGVSVAASFYCDDADTHDLITKRAGSHSATVRSLKHLFSRGVPVRVGIISMPLNASRIEQTIEFIHGLGISNVGVDRMRSIGRATDVATVDIVDEPPLTELCGKCWQGSLSVSADGSVTPCIMSRAWPVGSVRDQSLAEINASTELRQIRSRIYKEVWLPQTVSAESTSISHESLGAACNPECRPNCEPSCNPRCSPNCSPCFPSGKCNPQLFCGPCGPGK